MRGRAVWSMGETWGGRQQRLGDGYFQLDFTSSYMVNVIFRKLLLKAIMSVCEEIISAEAVMYASKRLLMLVFNFN